MNRDIWYEITILDEKTRKKSYRCGTWSLEKAENERDRINKLNSATGLIGIAVIEEWNIKNDVPVLVGEIK